jgi:hypothetical protein
MAHFIPLKKKVKQAENVVVVFACEISRLHGIPTYIVLEWDSQCTSKFWNTFLTVIGVKPLMVTVFHPKTDGQTQMVNQTIKALLRAFVNLEMSGRLALYPWQCLLITTVQPPLPDICPSTHTMIFSLTPDLHNVGHIHSRYCLMPMGPGW